MSNIRRTLLPASAIVLALCACARVRTVNNTSVPVQSGVVQQGAPAARHGRITDHVIVVSIDGLRPDAIDKFHARTLQRLMHEGRYSLHAQTIKLSLTLPSHTSVLTGVDY